MEVAYIYTKVRTEFGKDVKPVFKDVPSKLLENTDGFDGSILPNEEEQFGMTVENPRVYTFETSEPMSESEMNTDTVVIKSTAIKHTEGGWPKEVDPTEKQDVKRFITKAQKQEDFKSSLQSLGTLVTKVMKQNATVNIHEVYFEGDQEDHSSAPPSAKSLAVLRDPNELKRTAAKIAWQPGSNSRIGVAYAVMNFQDKRFSAERLSLDSYIWDITQPNSPERCIHPPSPLCCMAFNNKQHDTIAGGSYNGLASVYDLRREQPLVAQSEISTSHHDPIYDAYWISSKTGSQFTTISTDGQLLFWDAKNLSKPVDTVLLSSGDSGALLAGSALEYNSEAGSTKYLVGTEQGVVVAYNSKQKRVNHGLTVYDTSLLSKHHGPITAIQRNPIHSKFFLTVGDWCARIWVEDGKTPILTTSYHDSYLTGGCWSPSRPGVFFLTRADGVMNVWDYNLQQQECVYSHKVGDVPLKSIGICPQDPRLVAVGDADGTVSILEMAQSLADLAPNEKANVGAMFDREALQEKNLLLREREIKKAKAIEAEVQARADAMREASLSRDEQMEKRLREVDSKFMKMVKGAEEAESKKG